MTHNPFISTSSAHTKRYIESNGEDGHAWNGIYCLLLTTVGRKSGKTFTLPLIYGVDGESYVVVASKGGHPDHPYWYTNLVAHPTIEIQVGSKIFDATARTSSGKERERLWDKMTDLFERYNEYQDMTEREIPVVVLEPRR